MRLLEQLNGVVTTRDTPRGLVATVSDSSFSGSELREPLSSRIGRLAAILQPYPGLQIAVEGSSDSAANDVAGREACRERTPDVGRARIAGRPLPRSRSGRLAALWFPTPAPPAANKTGAWKS